MLIGVFERSVVRTLIASDLLWQRQVAWQAISNFRAKYKIS